MGYFFTSQKNIHIESITIEDCEAKIVIPNQWTNFTTISALMFYYSRDVEVMRIRMKKNLEYAMQAEKVFGNFTISYSAFLRCVLVTPWNRNFAIGANAKIMYIANHLSHTETNLLIENSWFLYGGENQKSGRQDKSSGLSVLMHQPKVNVLISNVKAMYNIGSNVDIYVDDYHKNTSSVTIKNSTIAFRSAAQGGWNGNTG